MIAAAELRLSPVLRGNVERAATSQHAAAHVPAVHCHFQMIPEQQVLSHQQQTWSPQLEAWSLANVGSAPFGADSLAVLWSDPEDAEIAQWSDEQNDI